MHLLRLHATIVVSEYERRVAMRESGEDYLEAILALEEDHKSVRLTDVALRLKVTKPSVNRAMKILQND